MNRRKYPRQETHVMRTFGTAFDPDRVCEYTGQPLHKFPIADNMGYWRADGFLCGVYEMTPEEKAWIDANPAQYEAERANFQAWRKKLT